MKEPFRYVLSVYTDFENSSARRLLGLCALGKHAIRKSR